MEYDKAKGAVFGAALGDSLGSPFEMLRAGAVQAIVPGGPEVLMKGQAGSLMFYHVAGDVSDDTFMSLGVLRGMHRSASTLSMRKIEKEFQLWMAGPNFGKSGPGIATTKALSSHRPASSEGNGACMKSHVSAAMIDDTRQALSHAQLVAEITHKSQVEGNNEAGARLTVYAGRYAAAETAPSLVGLITFIAQYEDITEEPMATYLTKTGQLLDSEFFLKTSGVSGWVFDTVTYAVAIWLYAPKTYLDPVRLAIACGGDTDTLACVVGGISGAHVGFEAIPEYLREGLLPEVKKDLLTSFEDCWARKTKLEETGKL